MKSRKHILIVDDVTTNLRFVGEILKDRYSLSMAKSGKLALKTLEKSMPNLIMLDVKMPDMDGYETFKKIKDNPKTANIPIVFLTADSSKENEEKGLKLGASAYIHKPFDPDELLRTVNSILEAKELDDEIKTLANKDSLTNLWNRKFLENFIKELANDGEVGSFLLFNFENLIEENEKLKVFLDEQILVEIGKVLSGCVHNNDVVARIGGKEFAIFLKNFVGEELLKSRIENLVVNMNDQFNLLLNDKDKSFVSLGISQLPTDGKTFLELYNNADKAMYQLRDDSDHSFHFYNSNEKIVEKKKESDAIVGLSQIQSLIEDDESPEGPMIVDYNDFIDLYRFMKRFAQRTGENLQLVLFTLKDLSSKSYRDDFEKCMHSLETAIRCTLRKNDVASKYSESQFLVVLSCLSDDNRSEVIQRVTECFENTSDSSDIILKVDIDDINFD